MSRIIPLYRFLFARRFFYKWNRTLLRCALTGLGVGNFGETISGEAYALRRYIGNKKNPTILDIGANVGSWSSLALKTNPNAQIFAFEPQKKAFQTLSKVNGIHTYNIGCGSAEEKRILYDRADTTSQTHSSLCKEVIEHLDKGVIEESVEITTVDRFVEENNLETIDLMKIDVEGFELEVLKGAQKTLEKGKIDAIQFEFNVTHVYQRLFFRDFLAQLPGYVFYRLLPKGKIPLRNYDPMLHELFDFQNIFAVRQEKS